MSPTQSLWRWEGRLDDETREIYVQFAASAPWTIMERIGLVGLVEHFGAKDALTRSAMEWARRLGMSKSTWKRFLRKLVDREIVTKRTNRHPLNEEWNGPLTLQVGPAWRSIVRRAVERIERTQQAARRYARRVLKRIEDRASPFLWISTGCIGRKEVGSKKRSLLVQSTGNTHRYDKFSLRLAA